MRKRLLLLSPLIVLAFALFIAVGGFVVQALWNWLLPTLFGWRQISFWQALGVLALCRILFGGFGWRGHHGFGIRRRMAERWERMTPEERERFRLGIRRRCGAVPPASEGEAQ